MTEDVEIHDDVLHALFTQDLGREIKRIADEKVVPRARSLAPKKTGEGAKSIHAEDPVLDGHTPVVRIGWDPDHFYMLYAEQGTSRQPATPFLRPALDATD